MPFNVPTLTAIRERIESDFNGRLPGADSRLPRGFLRVLSFAYATANWSVYQYQAWISRQRLPDTAEDEELDRFQLFGPLRTAEQAAAGTATVTGVDGSIVLTGSTLQTSDGVVYAVQADATIIAGAAILALRAVQAGKAGNLPPAAVLSFVSPVAGVNSGASVISMTGGLDLETDDRFRTRLLDHLRKPPQGGAVGDYVKWAKEQPGVTRAWEYPDWASAGDVGVLTVFDDRDDIIPTADDLAALQAKLDAKRPITTPVYAAAPAPNLIAFTIALNPSSDAIKAAVADELDDLLFRSGKDLTIPLEHIRQAIGLAAGDGRWRLDVPAADVTQTRIQLARRGVITWAAW